MKKNENTIYINGRFLTQKITGVQRYAIEVIKQLDKVETDYKIIILAPKKGIIQNLELTNIKIFNIGNLTGHLWEQISLPLYIIRHNRKSKLLNMCNLAPILFPGYTVIHDISFKTHSEHLSKKFSLWYRFITKMNIKRYRHIFTDSEFSKKEIVYNYNIDEKNITVTYVAANHIKDIEPNYSIINKLNLENKDFYFSLGSKSPHKNHKYIVECAKENAEALFVVSGNNCHVFKDDVNQFDDIKNLIYTGYLNDDEIVSLYKECKAFIFPSLYEGFGIPPLEAIECGCKNIILSDIPVFKEIYGKAAIYIDIKQKTKLDDLCNIEIDDLERKEIMNKYSWDKVANSIVQKIN